MSFWYEKGIKDLDVSLDGKDLHIWIDSDDFGNRYVAIPIEDIKKFMKDIAKNEWKSEKKK